MPQQPPPMQQPNVSAADVSAGARVCPAGLHRVESRSVQVQAGFEEEREWKSVVNGTTRVDQDSSTEENVIRLRKTAASDASPITTASS